ncbi:ABC transporter permease subunit [Hydrogenovibrio thermophilus]|uniref:ABC transporter permease subunit n=1 Tax=Hydrogenovibrio thermophilus TaxID=265883 RepID=A0A410H1I0_9GAMM|nr:ABC transporter permease subunit [Hydrogenovibrio thermophilus]QAB14766.1 ABC transporter permease subunit [Hydrogenovibrio thermophilus]
MDQSAQKALEQALKGPKFEKRIKRRNLVDKGWASSISVGGVGVILSVLLIMFFLVYVVAPLFMPASVKEHASYALPGGSQEKTLFYGMDEYKETAMRITESGKLIGFNANNGQLLTESSLPLNGESITSFARVKESDKLIAFGLSGGGVLLAKYGYKVTYPDNVRKITPALTFPFGQEPLVVADQPISKVAARSSDSQLVVAYQLAGQSHVFVKQYDKVESMLSDDVALEEYAEGEVPNNMPVDWLMMGGNMRNLYLVSEDGSTLYYDLSNIREPVLLQKVNMVNGDEHISSLRFLLGEYSLMVGTSKGRVLQWFPVRDENNNFQLEFIREFEVDKKPVNFIAIEHSRKGFVTLDRSDEINLYNATAERHLASVDLKTGLNFILMAERGNGALLETADGQMVNYDIKNEHPDVSFSSLWGKVWYEGYEEPSYTWQSSSASADFEPKFSMVPLTFGTIKAALYSMLFAVPIAVLAAIYTAFFMDNKTRQYIKPTIELIEALPTVILGFLAGLWLAPYMEAHLAGFFAILLVVPIGILLFGFGWSRLPEPVRLLIPTGRRAVLMLPVVVFLGWFALSLSSPIENLFFHGDMRHWLTSSAGIDFDQRNALVIGFAMGFALIPTIFSVAEDAIYNVPSYLVNGSLALGASGWQTLVGVVLPTASPGIFSAIMLGFGRGIGETMIVLMASGNTPLMDVNIFQGMRTLSANLAVEMPEAELYSSHYRVLFLSGLILFIFTFVFNTLAEVVRERMRRKYGSL